MARSWCGFDAQNEGIKEQWRLMEASREEVLRWVELLPKAQPEEDAEAQDVLYIPE